MRLIDADELKKLFPDNGEGSWTYNVAAKGYIDAQPTAYDIDGVVEQLKELQNLEERADGGYCPDNGAECRHRYSDLGCAYCAFEKAIEIVKKGGAE